MAKTYTILDTRFDNENFEAWKSDYLYDNEDNNYTEEELLNIYSEELFLQTEDEKCNLNKTVDGIIVAFADLGLWNGRFTGAKLFTGNINSILDLCGCDNGYFYSDRYNVKASLFHHDGTNYITYRVAKDRETAERILWLAESGKLTWEYFHRNTKSLTPMVSEIYGWTWGKAKKIA